MNGEGVRLSLNGQIDAKLSFLSFESPSLPTLSTKLYAAAAWGRIPHTLLGGKQARSDMACALKELTLVTHNLEQDIY